MLSNPSTASPPQTTTTQFLPPYPQPHSSIPYTASRHPVHSSNASRYNQQPQVRHTTPVSIPTVAVPTRPYIMPPSSQHARPPYAEFTSSPPRHHHYSPATNFVQQSPPPAYGSSMYNNGSNTAGNIGYYSSSQQWLFPPPSLPATTLSQGYEEIRATHMQSLHHHQQPQGHNPYIKGWPEFKQETEHKHKKSKSKSTKPPVTEKMVDAMVTDLPSQVSLGDIKQGKPAVRVGGTDKKRPVKGRGKMPRETLGAGHHWGKQRQHHQ